MAMLIVSAYLLYKTNQLREYLDDKNAEIESVQKQLLTGRALLSIDSLLVKGDYAAALQGYRAQLDAVIGEPLETEIQYRISLAQKLMQLQRRPDERNTDSIAYDTDSLMAANISSAGEVREIDSLRFALEKMDVQLRYLREQLREKSAGTYLTFSTSRGNTMHYVGEVHDDMANGRGIGILTTGSRYVGEWKDNKRHGQGIFYWPDGEYYQGEYRDDKRAGQGTYFWPSGEKFIGEWEEDERNGQGTFYNEDGEVMAKGIWKDDELVEVEKE